jgi:hypothetical protein
MITEPNIAPAAAASTCGCQTGSQAATATATTPAPAAPPCCGTAHAAAEAGACCDPNARSEAVAAGASCC